MKSNIDLDKESFFEALDSGDTECIEYLIENNCPFGLNTLCMICEKDDIVLLKRLNESCRYDDNEYLDIYDYVYSLEVLKYVYEVMEYKDIDECTFASIAEHGNVEMISYLLEKGCPVETETLDGILFGDNVEVVRFIHEKVHKLDDNVNINMLPKDSEVRQYYHDFAMKRGNCGQDCYNCLKNKLCYLWERWELIDNNYQSCIQWLPREMMEDIELFCLDKSS